MYTSLGWVGGTRLNPKVQICRFENVLSTGIYQVKKYF